MKRQLVMLAMGLIVMAGQTQAQAISKDSLKMLNNEKEQLKVAKSLNDKKLKLAELENKIASREADIKKASEESQKAVDDNQRAADALTNDPMDKGKLSAAKKAGNNADKKASAARKALERLSDLKNDIEKQRKRITEDEQKLASLGGSVTPLSGAMPPGTTVSDSIRAQ